MKPKLLILLTLILLYSCGTRKRAMDLEKVSIQEINEKLERIENRITANVKLTKQANILKLQPIDPTKESSYTDTDGKTTTFTNSQVLFDSSTTDSTATKTDLSVSTKKENSESDTSTKKKVVAVETKKPNPYLWGCVVVVVCFGLYLVYRKFKK